MCLQCFIDPSTGTKLFSKPEVLRYLGSEKTKQHNAESSRQKDRGGSEHSSSKVCFIVFYKLMLFDLAVVAY